MKTIFLAIMFLITGKIAIPDEAEKDIKAPVTIVTVFPDRAHISHEAKVDIPAGTTVYRLSALSPYIDARTIQVKGYGNFMVLSVTHRKNYLRNLEDSPEAKSITSQIEDLQLKVEDEKAAIAVSKEKEAFLIANRGILIKETPFSLEQLKSVMDMYTNNIDQVTRTILIKNRLIKEYEKQIEVLRNQLSGIIGKQELPSGEILVTLVSEKPSSAKLVYSYVVSNAGWFPSYDIRVEDISKPVSVYYKANVFQNSGVEWKNVKLSFSNATPWVSGDIPVLLPWFIDYFNPVPVTRAGSTISGVERSAPLSVPEMELMAEGRDNDLAEAMPLTVEKRIGETTVNFDVALPQTIAPDGKVRMIEIQRTTVPAEYRYVAVPKISPLVYLTGNITGWEEQHLIGGEANLYFENTFVGKSHLNVNQLNDTLVISLGTDNSILVNRVKRQDFTSKRTLGSNKTETFSFLLTVRNNKESSVKISVYDQIPISTNSGIVVEAIELSGGKSDSRTGEIIWDLVLKPRETREIILSYSVRYPKDRTIILE